MRPAARSLRSILRPAAFGVFMLSASACGGSDPDDPDDPTGPNPPASNSLVGGWTGMTSQDRPFAMHVDDTGVALIMIGFSVPGSGCPQGTSVLPFEPPSTPLVITSGAFTLSTSGSAGTRIISGSFGTTGGATGTLVINDTNCGGQLNATWTATKATSAAVDLSGTWNGTFKSSLVSQTAGVLTLTQSGTNVTGTYNIPSNGAGGTVSAQVFGRTVRFTMTQTTPASCPGTFTGHAVLMPSPELLVYNYTGSDCLGTHITGNGSGSRQAGAAIDGSRW